MSEKNTVILTWMTISLGIIFVIAGIALASFLNRTAGLGVPEFIQSAIGAAIGVALWFLWLSRRDKKDG